MASLQSREFYEKLYDRATIDHCRSMESMVNKTFCELEKKAPDAELRATGMGWYLAYSMQYLFLVEKLALERFENRTQTIFEWMEKDEQEDRQLASALVRKTPYCRNCGKDMKQTMKTRLRRDEAGSRSDDILFMFQCDPCNKRLGVWQDGTEWEGMKVYCDKCGAIMDSSSERKADIITTTYSCAGCGHSYSDELKLGGSQKKEKKDKYYELDRKRFCLDSEVAGRCKARIKHAEHMKKINQMVADKQENGSVYDAVDQIKTLKIAQLPGAIKPTLEKSQFTEFKLGEPNIGREVTVEFSCLDAKPDREEHASKKELKKLIEKSLLETNWRLMSDGLHGRLGYLNGRLRAFESKEDLKKLVETRITKGTLKLEKKEPQPKSQEIDPTALRHKAEALTEDLKLKTTKQNKNGKPQKQIHITGVIHHNLRVAIPRRENDESVPKFVRDCNFEF